MVRGGGVDVDVVVVVVGRLDGYVSSYCYILYICPHSSTSMYCEGVLADMVVVVRRIDGYVSSYYYILHCVLILVYTVCVLADMVVVVGSSDGVAHVLVVPPQVEP